MTKDEALKLALKALEAFIEKTSGRSIRLFMETERHMAIYAWDSISQVLAQHDSVQAKPEPEQEPVAWLHRQGNFTEACMNPLHDDEIDRGWTQEPLYTTPPQRKPLTDEELSHIYEEYHDCYGQPINANENGWAYERAIEAAHGIKDGA